ncbi:RuBisCO accumulation factor 1 [Gloeobacter morelensis]|uniref:RuBisCO accumulation factor 1 n=1 Tax=Gloeobacter morelensis MG652769 TaxID=2781736 RepID=A0ABY3PHF2_9CYAN|nr:RuBisCO accumulation factor 1 [Gloeobacter morelensis]UFP93064.1 hypothetical protein ISF26_14740 [Gloeobacter morelensis MG652769]
MSEFSQSEPTGAPIDIAAALEQLRRKEGDWVEWGQILQQLHAVNQDPQSIFEATGFEPSRQNLFVVGAQVWAGLESVGTAREVLSHFRREGSNVLYELRVLGRQERQAAAELALARKLDPDGAREVAKAIKDLAHTGPLPEGFTRHPGDAVACRCWQLARQTTDLRERTQLIAKGLAFAHSETARVQLEKLLVDFTAPKVPPAPRLPFYRLEDSEELPRVLPMASGLPLGETDFKALPWPEEVGPFRAVAGEGGWVAMPGYQIIRSAEAPIAIATTTDQLPGGDTPEPVLVVVDREARAWRDDSYFLVTGEPGQLQLAWFAEAPEVPLFGQVIVVLRPKRILDEEFTKDPWQLDE